MQLQVLYEDNHLIAVNKPAGYLSQSDATGDVTVMDLVKEYIKVRYGKPGDVFLGSIHRLDRPVSGVILFARTSKGLTRMTELFRERKVTKTYWAIVAEQPSPIEGRLEGYIYKDPQKNLSKVLPKANSNRHQGAKKAVLDYRLLGRVGSNVLLEVKPETGRPHQIRVQLAQQLDSPIRGDLKYGFRQANEDGNINLHSRSLEFLHPVKKEHVRIVAEPPRQDQMWQLFAGIE
ncbi:23S rRNA pseudouridine1911/1915/1917 synthase [Lewinella marina]|uniref:RNA pseudouridine synthase n=1 Tax=Neolewinella marina TaxID=438751 RepID=A0A2G0CFU6_9BACT|nr:RluA family pseudouridine synthase [Neolewinella marina]NJB85444.1 23S rRNA pseudouridine1911/1915/1917 synthase [Neolewinella marina]PHK98864.1 RNA pseudouridine synthase [Neolewinella marina]